VQCAPFSGLKTIRHGTTELPGFSVDLPANGDNDFYLFRVTAERGGIPVGDLHTHDVGALSWNYRFRVVDRSLPLWVYLLGVVVPGCVVAGAMFLLRDPLSRSARLRSIAWGGASLIIVIAATWGVRRYQEDRMNGLLATQQTQHAADERILRENFGAAFRAIAPLPDWWEEVSSAYAINDLGTLFSAWQSYSHIGEHEEGDRSFFKAAYLAILAHPEDTDLVVKAIDMIGGTVPSYPHHIALLEFGLSRYFDYDQRTDNCANCMTGDTINDVASSLAWKYVSAGRPGDAVAVLERVIGRRKVEISDYKLAETHNTLAQAYWAAGNHERALAVLEGAIEAYGATMNGDSLRRMRAHYLSR